MGMEDQMFCQYVLFLKETEQDEEQFKTKALKAVNDYITMKELG